MKAKEKIKLLEILKQELYDLNNEVASDYSIYKASLNEKISAKGISCAKDLLLFDYFSNLIRTKYAAHIDTFFSKLETTYNLPSKQDFSDIEGIYLDNLNSIISSLETEFKTDPGSTIEISKNSFREQMRHAIAQTIDGLSEYKAISKDNPAIIAAKHANAISWISLAVSIISLVISYMKQN